MFDGEEKPRHWRLYVGDMIEFSEKVLSYTDGFDQDAFVLDGVIYDATLRNIELIGEAATMSLTRSVKRMLTFLGASSSVPETAWRMGTLAWTMM